MKRVIHFEQKLQNRRGAALYLAVMTIALLVSLLGLSGISIMRLERDQMNSINDRIVARSHSRSAIELAVEHLRNDATWRENLSSGVETTPLQLSTTAAGTISYQLTDTDGDLTNADQLLTLFGIGRVGDAVQVSSVNIQSPREWFGPSLLSSRTSSDGTASTEILTKDRWFGQYLKPDLPPEATSWRITSIEIYGERWNGNQDFTINIYEPDGSNYPSESLLDSVTVNSNAFTTSISWVEVPMSGVSEISSADGICLTLETSVSLDPVKFGYLSGGVTVTDSALITGNPTWNTYETNKALMYRIYGEYNSGPGSGIEVVAGTWEQASLLP